MRRLIWTALLMAVAGCTSDSDGNSGGAGSVEGSDRISVYVVNYPLAFVAERIGGADVAVFLPVPSNIDPAFWRPTPEQIVPFQDADVVLLNGANYARWVKTASLPWSRVVDTTAECKPRFIRLEGAVVHSHGPDGEHSHEGVAAHLWLDPTLLAAQADAVAAALSRHRPNSDETFQGNLAELKDELIKLDDQLKGAVGDQAARPVLFSHPIYQYLIRRYELNGRSVDWESTEMPPQESWDQLTKLLESHPAKWMVWEAPPRQDIVARLGELGIRSVVFDTAANVPEDGNYMTVMKDNIQRLAAVYEAEP